MRKLLAWVGLALACAGAPAEITLNEKEYFEAPGFVFLVFHNNYMSGNQGGLQMVQNGERVLDSGDLYVASGSTSTRPPTFLGPGWTLVRAAGKVHDARFTAVVRRLATEWRRISSDRARRNPYGVHYPEEVLKPGYKLESRTAIHSGFVWAHGWSLQSDALRRYFLHKHLPEQFTERQRTSSRWWPHSSWRAARRGARRRYQQCQPTT
jgi:hypothetical protein